MRRHRITVEVTANGVRQYCNYISSRNPLHMDEGYARRARWGGIVSYAGNFGAIFAASAFMNVSLSSMCTPSHRFFAPAA